MRCFRFLTILVPTVALLGCTKPPPQPAAAPPAPVSVVAAVKKTVPVRIRVIGSVKAVATVAVRPRVGGELTAVHFKEGEYVTKKQKLFSIDSRPFETAIKQAEANLAKATAVLKGAELDLTRVERGAVNRSIAQFEIDTARTAVASAKASVEAEEAALKSARIQFDFTTIYSAIDGRVGEVPLTVGNTIDANGTTPLAVINQVSPIYVTFALPERRLPEVGAARRKAPLAVQANLRDGETNIGGGVLSFIDNAVNTGSGTVQLKAEFPNLDRKLWPGQFVDVVLNVRERPDSVTVPTAAIQSGQKGSFVFVVEAGRAVMKPVVVAFEEDQQAVIESGLKEGESVVIDGQLRLISGTPVDVKKAPAPETATPAPTPQTSETPTDGTKGGGQ